VRERLMEIRVLTWRCFLHSKRTPMVLIAGLIQPIIWLTLFSAVFKNSPIRDVVASGSYLGFIMPGALVFTALTGALNGGVPILFDRELGFLDRLLASPLRSRLSIIWATGAHIFIMTLLQCAVIILLTVLMGIRIQAGPAELLVIVVTLAMITLLFTTLSLTLAFVLRRHFELISIVMIVSLPIAFVSTAFAPVDFMPVWLSWPVALNPVTLAVEPLRNVFFETWTWGGGIFDAPFGKLSIAGCLIALAILNAIMALLARAVILKKLR